MAPHAKLVTLLRALWGRPTQSPYSIWIDEQDEEAACGGTLLHIMSQGHGRGGLWWVEMDFDDGQQQVVHGTGGLVAGFLCVDFVA